MPHPLLYLIVFIEGFCSLGAEIIALRRLVPHMGSAIVVTAPTIGLFLLALALGYASGARKEDNFRPAVARNFLLAALLTGAGFARFTVDGAFANLGPTWLAYLFLMGGVLCPLAWLLGQTVPILTNLMKHARAGEASGYALYWSTLGSFAGSVSLSLLVMQWLGVGAAVLACSMLLVTGSLLLVQNQRLIWGQATAVAVIALAAYAMPPQTVLDTAYADYEVKPLVRPDQSEARGFLVNNSLASLIDDNEPPRYARYVQRLRHILLQELALSGTDILVLGAGGFTLAHREPSNRYTFVDVDPDIRQLAETHFLKQPISATFVVDDARHFVRHTQRRFAAVVVDVFSNHNSIPNHLVTAEFWADTRQALAPSGHLLVNLILDSTLSSPYATNVLTSIESVYGRCSVEVLHRMQAVGNVLVVCQANGQPRRGNIYTDERNGADWDKFR